MNQEQIKEAIHQDYYRVLGKVIFPHEVDGYIGQDSVVVLASGLHPFVVLPTSVNDLERLMGSDCWDPVWDVQPLYPAEFQKFVRESLGVDEDLRSMWVYGHSYRENHPGIAEASKLRYSDTFVPGGSVL